MSPTAVMLVALIAFLAGAFIQFCAMESNAEAQLASNMLVVKNHLWVCSKIEPPKTEGHDL